MEGVVNVVPVAKAAPPLEFANQLRVPPAEDVAPKVAVPVPQISAGLVAVTLGMVLMVAVTATRGDEVQLALLVST